MAACTVPPVGFDSQRPALYVVRAGLLEADSLKLHRMMRKRRRGPDLNRLRAHALPKPRRKFVGRVGRPVNLCRRLVCFCTAAPCIPMPRCVVLLPGLFGAFRPASAVRVSFSVNEPFVLNPV